MKYFIVKSENDSHGNEDWFSKCYWELTLSLLQSIRHMFDQESLNSQLVRHHQNPMLPKTSSEFSIKIENKLELSTKG